MQFIRVIPVLLLSKGLVYKTVKFKRPKYIGEAINAVKIFNEKESDELILMDIGATKERNEPNISSLKEIVSEAFMPIGYGGGISSLHQIENLFKIGIEKVIINSALYTKPNLVNEASKIFGSQSVVVSVDVKKNFWGTYVPYSISGTKKQRNNINELLISIQDQGAGEIIINSIDKDGTMEGYELELIANSAELLSIPIVALGGAKNIEDFEMAIKNGASAVAAGSMFVFQGPHKAVLISYINSDELNKLIKSKES